MTQDLVLASANGHFAVELRNKVRASAENRPAVYRMLGPQDEIIYVGKSISVRNRLLSYFRADRGEKAAEIISHTRRIAWEYVPSEFASLLTEVRLIQKYRPVFNVEHKRDRNFCFIKLSSDVAPRLSMAINVLNDGAEYFGPFRGRAMIRDVLREVSDALELRDCAASVKMRFADQMDLFDADHTPKCIRADVHKCLAPCAGRCTKTEYHGRVLEARKFLKGDVDKPLTVLNDRMQHAADRLQFEYAAQLRDRAAKLDEARYELMAARSSIEALSFLYRCVGYNGEERWYVIKRGAVKAEWALPNFEEARRILSRREYTTTVNAQEVHEVLLVAKWFRIRPLEMQNTMNLTQLQAQ